MHVLPFSKRIPHVSQRGENNKLTFQELAQRNVKLWCCSAVDGAKLLFTFFLAKEKQPKRRKKGQKAQIFACICL